MNFDNYKPCNNLTFTPNFRDIIYNKYELYIMIYGTQPKTIYVSCKYFNKLIHDLDWSNYITLTNSISFMGMKIVQVLNQEEKIILK